MIIDVYDIQRALGASLTFEGTQTLEDTAMGVEILQFHKPFAVQGTVTNGGELLVLRASVTGSVRLQCGSCTEGYEHQMSFTLDARIKKAAEEEDPDVFCCIGDQMNLQEMVLEHLILELPILRRCREDCKGLCPRCGNNLNEGDCACAAKGGDMDEASLDQRLKALQDYFPPKGKEV